MEKEEQKEVTKVCKGCGRKLPLSMFNKNKTMKDGYINKCKECIKKYKQELFLKKHPNKRRYHRFTEEDYQFIRDNYLTMTYEQIGDVLGVSQDSITNKVIQLGLIGKLQVISKDKKGYRIIGSKTRAVSKYHSMLSRVRRANPKKDKAYMGIKVLVSKEDFIRWYMPRDFVGASVDRIDSKGHYSLDNMQVISMHDNIVKACKNRVKAHDGVTVCYVCKEEKPLEYFVKNRCAYSGYLNICKKCHKEKQKQYRMRKKLEEQCHTSSEK